MIHVLIVEDSRITRKSIENRFALMPECQVVASIENAANAEIVCMGGRVDLVLMDVCTADDESGLQAASRIKRYNPDVRIIVMTSVPEHSFIRKAKEAGCDGFWYKESREIDLLDLCRHVMRGEKVWPEEIPSVSVGCTDSADLTERELDVMRELALGYKYEEIAQHLGISANTVKYHIKNLLQKTGCRNTLQLISEVVEKRLIMPRF